MTILYPQLTQDTPLTLAEPSTEYTLFTERHLQAMWLEQKYFHSLSSSDGTPITVVSQGVWNSESGPDFRHAHLLFGGVEARGDIEIHLRRDNWENHSHDKDPRYNDVILHVVLWDSPADRPTLTAAGESVPIAVVEPRLTVPLSRIVRLIDLDLYPYTRFAGSGHCASALFARLSDKETSRLFQMGATWRLRRKADYLQAWVEDKEWRLPAGIAMALGYKKNTQALLELFLALLPHRHRDGETLLALALGMAGFFEKQYTLRWRDSPYYRHLQQIWGGVSADADHQCHLALDHIRPLNNPVRRLAALTKLLTDPQTPRLFDAIEAWWKQRWAKGLTPRAASTLLKELIDLLPDHKDPYWNHHYTFEETSREHPLSLIGSPLKKEIIINTVLPLLHHQVLLRADPDEHTALFDFYGALPASPNSKSRYLSHRLFGDSPHAQVLNRVIHEQGAYQLHRDFCVHYEASCIGCPFVERYNSIARLQKPTPNL